MAFALMLKITSTRDYYPPGAPPREYYVKPEQIEQSKIVVLSALLGPRATETLVDRHIQKYPALLGQCLNFTNYGHHGIWVVPQKLVDPGATPTRRGQRPDYLIGGKSSDGYQWMVVELKSPNAKLFSRAKDKRGTITLSKTANEGICQLLQYMSYCNTHQAYIRSHFKLTDLGTPRGILVIGRSAELEADEQLRELRQSWNNSGSAPLTIRTYDAFLRTEKGFGIQEAFGHDAEW